MSFYVRPNSVEFKDYVWSFPLRVNPANNDEYYAVWFQIQIADIPGAGSLTARLYEVDGGGKTFVSGATSGLSAQAEILAGEIYTINVTSAGAVSVDIGDIPNGPFVLATPMSLYGGYSGIGVASSDDWEGGGTITFNTLEITGVDASQSGRAFTQVAISGGDIYSGGP